MVKKTADRLAKKIVDKNPALKKLKSASHGEQYSEISTGVNDAQYKAGYDKIDWNKGKKDGTKPKPKFKIKINGVYQDNDDETNR